MKIGLMFGSRSALRQRVTCLAVAASAGSLLFAQIASADSTWIGSASSSWSNPANWSPASVPAPGTNLFIGGTGGTIVQDISDPFSVGNIQFLGQATEITGGALSLTAGAMISNSFAPHRIRARVNIDSSATLHGVGGYVDTSIAFDDLRGAGDVTVDGNLVIFGASYSGTTTIGPIARLWVGGRQGIGNIEHGVTTGQGDYIVNGGLLGSGTIGLASGAAVRLHDGGYISPSIGFTIGANDTSKLSINGALAIGSGANMAIDTSLGVQIINDRIDVSGLLDLSGANDNLFVGNSGNFHQVPQQAFVIATYGSRIGEFDLLNNGTNPNYGIIYTSAPNSGPGQVIIVTPEPSATACVFTIAAVAMRRPVRSRHA